MVRVLLLILLGAVAAYLQKVDHDGSRAAALQQAVSAASPNATIVLSGVYNFSTKSFVIEGKQGLTLAGQNALLLFGYKHNGHHSDEQTGSIQAGVNITNSEWTTLKGAAIDYRPKAPVLFCPNPRSPNSTCGGVKGGSGPGITVHMFNSSSTLVEDVIIHAAPYMAITSFNGEGGHVIRRVHFRPNEPGQIFVAERDGVHESDVRRGITVEDSTIGFLNDDFMNIHSTLLVVQRCTASRCIFINPHVEGGAVLDTTYGMNSLLEGVRSGDTIGFFPLLNNSLPKPKRLVPLFHTPAVVTRAVRVVDQDALNEAAAFAIELSKSSGNDPMPFSGAAQNCFGVPRCFHFVDVWSVDFEGAVLPPVPPGSLASVNELSSAGARFVGNNFTHTTCSARWKSSNSLLANNSFSNSRPSIEITYLQEWLEGPVLIQNVTFDNNSFYFGKGVNPVHPNEIDTSGIVERNNRFLPAVGDGSPTNSTSTASTDGDIASTNITS
jgi:hypothetical protein